MGESIFEGAITKWLKKPGDGDKGWVLRASVTDFHRQTEKGRDLRRALQSSSFFRL